MVRNFNPRIVLAGSVGSSRRTLQGLLRHRMNVVGVLGLSPEAARNVSGYTRLDDLAKSNNIPYMEFRNINEPIVEKAIRSWNPDLFFVVGLSQLVEARLLKIPRWGCVGFHPTWLPEGRGRAPVAWLILENRPGAATFFLMDERADSGPILVQEPFYVSQEDYASDVIEKIESAIDRALDRWLPQLIAKGVKAVSQNERLASYFGRRAPEDGLIDWKWPASKIYALVRAVSKPYPGAYTYFKNKKLIVWRVKPENTLPFKGVPGRILHRDPKLGFLVQTGKGLLWLQEIEFADEDADPFQELRVGVKLGYNLEDEIFKLKHQLLKFEEKIKQLENQFREGKR